MPMATYVSQQGTRGLEFTPRTRSSHCQVAFPLLQCDTVRITGMPDSPQAAISSPRRWVCHALNLQFQKPAGGCCGVAGARGRRSPVPPGIPAVPAAQSPGIPIRDSAPPVLRSGSSFHSGKHRMSRFGLRRHVPRSIPILRFQPTFPNASRSIRRGSPPTAPRPTPRALLVYSRNGIVRWGATVFASALLTNPSHVQRLPILAPVR